VASRTLTVFLVDLKGYTSRTAASSRDEITKLLRNYRGLITPVVNRFGGRIVKGVGDAFLIAFESPTNAVIAGAFLQDLLRRRNRTIAESERLEVRVAVHSGEVEEIEGDIFGETVNALYRIEETTKIGEVYFTESVFLTMNRNEIPTRKVGEYVLKGLPGAVRLYKVVQDPADARYRKLLKGAPPVRRFAPGGRRRWRPLALGAIALGAVAAAVAAFGFLRRPDPDVVRARALVAEGRSARAVDELGRAFERRLPPREALALAADAGVRAIEARLTVKDFDGARQLAGRWAARWSALRALPVRVALAESAHLVAAGREEEAVEALRAALAKHAGAWELHLALSNLYARPGRPEMHTAAVDEIGEAVSRCNADGSLPAGIEDALWARFAAQPPAFEGIADKRATALCDLVYRHLWPKRRVRLLAACASDLDTLRLNSFAVVRRAGAAADAPLMAHHVRNLTYPWPERQAEAIEFLSARTEAAERTRSLEALRAAADVLAGRTDLASEELLKLVQQAIARLEGPLAPTGDGPAPVGGAPERGGR